MVGMALTDHDLRDNLDQQRALYGQPLGERFGVLREAYGVSQRSLAGVLGLSAPMLSQLGSGQRIKIGNPAVYARLVMLEERMGEGDRAAVLEEVRASDPVLTTRVRAVTGDGAAATSDARLDDAAPDAFAAAHHHRASAAQWDAVLEAARRSGADELVALFSAARSVAAGDATPVAS